MRPDDPPREPALVVRMLAPIRSAMIGMFTGPVAGLALGAAACGACGLAITPDEAERAWMRSRWAR